MRTPMGFKRGVIYLANFNPTKGTEPGKIRPCLALKSDLLNEAGHPSTTVVPLTSQLIDDAVPLRFRISARDKLQSDSDVMIEQIRTIDNKRISNEPLTVLTDRELAEVEEYLKIVLGLGDWH
jgi:mRNA interferase MazF